MKSLQQTLILAALLSLAVVHHGFGQLNWEARQLDFRPHAEEPEIHGDFVFANEGTTTITITDVKPSCGCTAAQLTKKTYAPGEKGKIATTFTIGDRVGLQQKYIMVKTDHPDDPLIQLTIRAVIPELIKMEPRMARWELNGAAGEQVIKLMSGTEQPICVVGVQTTDDRLLAKLKMIEPGKEYAVTVTASDLREPMRAMVRVETDYPAGKPKIYQIPVEIGGPPKGIPQAAPVAPAAAPHGLLPVAPAAMLPARAGAK